MRVDVRLIGAIGDAKETRWARFARGQPARDFFVGVRTVRARNARCNADLLYSIVIPAVGFCAEYLYSREYSRMQKCLRMSLF